MKTEVWKKSQKLEILLFFLSLILLPTQLGKHFFPDFSYIFSLKIDYLSPTIYLWDLIVLALFSTWQGKGLILRKIYINQFALLLLLLFLLTQIPSLFSSMNIGAGLFRLEQLFIAGLFGLYIASQKKEFTLPFLKRALVLTVFIESVLAIFQFLFERSLGFWILGERSFTISTPSIATFNFYGEIFLRPYGTFPHPNVLGAFMVLAVPLLALSIKTQTRIFKFIFLLTFITTILTFSRGAIIILLFETLVFFRKNIKLVLSLFLISLPFVYTRFSSVLNFDNLSLVRREELADFAIKLFLQNPLFGVGLNNFINQIATSDLISGPSRFLQPVHNIFLLSLAETGILGLFGLLILTTIPLVKSLKDKTKIYLALFLIIIFLGLFDHYFLTLAQGQRLFFLIWSLSMLNYFSDHS